MQGITSHRLSDHSEEIMSLWEKRAMQEVSSATAVTNLALRDSLPLYLAHLSEALAKNRKMDVKAVAEHDAKSVRIGRLHGADRAGSASYVLTEVIFEYHILREVIFEGLEPSGQLSKIERDIILDSIEQAVNDAVVRFSEVHADIQQKFVNTLTHDLKTPITSAKMNAQLIAKRPESPDLCMKSATRITASLDRLDSMIHDLLDVSRLRAGEDLTPAFTSCDLDEIVHDVIDEMTAIYGDRFAVESSGKMPGSWACDGLRRTFENLVGNAVKYSTSGSLITISSRKLEAAVEIEVHNIGNPIPEKDQALLFQQYRRTKSAKDSAVGGWGIGLTLVKGIVDAQRGSIRVTSTPETGTHFIITLPTGSLSSASVA